MELSLTPPLFCCSLNQSLDTAQFPNPASERKHKSSLILNAFNSPPPWWQTCTCPAAGSPSLPPGSPPGSPETGRSLCFGKLWNSQRVRAVPRRWCLACRRDRFPWKKKQSGCRHLHAEAWRSSHADHQRGLGATVVAAASVCGSLCRKPCPLVAPWLRKEGKKLPLVYISVSPCVYSFSTPNPTRVRSTLFCLCAFYRYLTLYVVLGFCCCCC